MIGTAIVVFAIAALTSETTLAAGAETATMESDKETIAVLGTGDMGDSFGPRLASLGYRVIYGSRSPDSERVTNLMVQTGHGASADTYRNAARDADIILIAVASHAVEEIVGSLGNLNDKVVIDLNWPPTRYAEDGYEEITIATSVAERIQEMRPQALVVKAFGTMASNVIDDPNVAGGPVTAPIASDHRRAKETVARIAAELGLDPVDAGPLRMARHLESLMMLYMIPHNQGRQEGWDFYFRRSNYWSCNAYTGGELDESEPAIIDAGNLAEFPNTQGEPEPCAED